MNVVEHLLKQVFYVDGEVVRKHLPVKKWPKPKLVAKAVKATAAAKGKPPVEPPRSGE